MHQLVVGNYYTYIQCQCINSVGVLGNSARDFIQMLCFTVIRKM